VQHKRARRILDRKASDNLFRLLADPRPRIRRDLIAAALRLGARRGTSGNGRLYLNVGHTGLNDEGFRDWVRRNDVRPVYLVHDLIPITNPEYCRAGEARKHRERMRTVLETGAGVIGNSRATVDDLERHARDEGLPMPPSVAALLGSDLLPAGQRKGDHERPIFVTLGTIEARKNHILLLRIWQRLVKRLGPASPRLIIIGQRGWEAEPVFNILDSDESLRGHVQELNGCTDPEIAAHLSTARALLFPSLAEGYGLPLIEALGAGVPAIASDLPVFRELAGELPYYLAPTDEPAWEAAIVDYARQGSESRKAQVRRIERFSMPDWPSHFRTVEEWLATLPAHATGAPAMRR
jgi:glycosyltransferase involved in cell wall biosynthesis